jgi:hypothetical protein
VPVSKGVTVDGVWKIATETTDFRLMEQVQDDAKKETTVRKRIFEQYIQPAVLAAICSSTIC